MAIDLFGGSSSITGTNLFKVDKDPLIELDEGVEDVIGQKAKGIGAQIISIIESILEGILGVPSGTFPDLSTYFGNMEKFLGDLNPLDPNFLANLEQAAVSFITKILQPSNLVAMLVQDASQGLGLQGFVPIENLAMELIQGILGTAQEVIDAILAAVGWPSGTGDSGDVNSFFTDLMSMLSNPPLASTKFDPISAIEDFITSMLHPTGLLLDPSSSLNALNLFNVVPQSLIGFVPFSHVGEGNPNLLANGSFEGAASVQGSGIWLWDGTVGNTSPGSVYTVADGTNRTLVSNAIPVSPDQQLNLSVYAMWSGLVYTSVPIKVQVLRLLNYAHVGVDDLAAPSAPAADQATWVQLGGDYTVPAGTDMICLQLTVTTTATAGTVRFDDGDVHKTGNAATFIPSLNVLGVGGPLDIGSTVRATWDQLISGFVGTPGGTGAGLADMFGIGQTVSSWASLGNMSFDILGIRNNKPIDQGLMSTSLSNFPLSKVALQSSAPTIAVTQGVSAIGFLRMAESNDKGVISWLGSGNANITACYVIVWEMDATVGDMTCTSVSPNIVGSLFPTMAWVVYQMPALTLTHANDLYGIEIMIVGSGTHQVAGSTTWIPNHPNSAVFPKTYAATRNSGTSPPAVGAVIPHANIAAIPPAPAAGAAYSTNVPWLEWGITVGGTTTYPDESVLINVVGSESVPIPAWANHVDVIPLGAGAGGGPGGYFAPLHNGGGAGKWATATWARNTDFGDNTIIDVTVPAGGLGSTGGSAATAGGNAVATTRAQGSFPAKTVTGAGGPINYGQDNGQGVAALTYNGVPYTGGGPQNADSGAGAVPGGGGASGPDTVGGNGGPGAAGAVWLVFRQS